MSPYFSIVIPNYNGEKRLGQCLDAALSAAKASGHSYEVIVVDDASTDHSCELVKEKFPTIKLIESKKNEGFSITSNQGVDHAAGEWVLILNNDAYLSESYFNILFNYLDSSPQKPFALMGSILDMNGKLIDAAKYPEVPTALLARGLRSTLNVSCGEAMTPTLFSSGANALVHRKTFLELGGFDTLYSPYYLEDVDLGVSAWRFGHRSEYLPQATCRHEVSGTISAQKPVHVRAISKRNKWIFHFKHLPMDALFFWILIHSVELGLGLFFKPKLYWPLIQGLWFRLPLAWAARAQYPHSLRSVILKLKTEFHHFPTAGQKFF
jgi:GT2 family glycosyltransferase